MHFRFVVTAFLASLVAANPVFADAAAPALRAGDTAEIRLSYSTEEHGKSSSGSSSGHDTILERVISVTAEGVEYEYDLPLSVTKADHKREWFFPVRVFRPSVGAAELRNRPELESRLDKWLASAKWTREMCGRWIFTWNAFQIVCDPKKALDAVEPFDLRAVHPHDGATMANPAALENGIIRRTASSESGVTYVSEFAVNPAVVRQERAEAAVVVGEITGEPVTLQKALNDLAKEQVTGTIRITYETDPDGRVRRRTTETNLETKQPDGAFETSKRIETAERVSR